MFISKTLLSFFQKLLVVGLIKTNLICLKLTKDQKHKQNKTKSKKKTKMAAHGSSCGACKFLRRKCNSDCVFAPYFSYEQASSHFAAVHKVFGASNVSKHLLHLPLHQRNAAAITISYEALSRMHDPVYGCVAHIFALHQQVSQKICIRFFCFC